VNVLSVNVNVSFFFLLFCPILPFVLGSTWDFLFAVGVVVNDGDGGAVPVNVVVIDLYLPCCHLLLVISLAFACLPHNGNRHEEPEGQAEAQGGQVAPNGGQDVRSEGLHAETAGADPSWSVGNADLLLWIWQ
jgi:hypothetical protein